MTHCWVCMTPSCGREGHPCTEEYPRVDEGLAQRLWEVCTGNGMGSGRYSWDELREGERERFRHGVRVARGDAP